MRGESPPGIATSPPKYRTVGTFESLSGKIDRRDLVCGVMGLGYVGLPLAVEMGCAGLRVLGFEVSERVAALVNAGESHIKDVKGADVALLRKSGKLEATTDMSRLGECDVISICVPTPLGKTKDPDMSYIVAATEAIVERLRPGQIVVLESTTYPGTTRELMLPRFESNGLQVGKDFFLCFSPERVDPGNPKWHTKNTPKVLGGVTAALHGARRQALPALHRRRGRGVVARERRSWRSCSRTRSA